MKGIKLTELTFEELFDVKSDTRWANKVIVEALGKTRHNLKELPKDTDNFIVELKVNGLETTPIRLDEYMEQVSQQFMVEWRKRYSCIEDQIQSRVEEKMDIIMSKLAEAVEEVKY